MFDRFRKKENRASLEDPDEPITAENFHLHSGGFGPESESGVKVTIDKALGLPSVWAAVNFLSGTIASLPLHVYKKTTDGRKKVKTDLARALHDAPNDEMSSYAWRKYTFDRVFTSGRGYTLIDRNAAGKVANLWPLNPQYMTVRQGAFGKRYEYKLPGQRAKVYEAKEIIDIPFMLEADGLTHRSPILSNKDAIGLAISARQYGSKFFSDGGVPPFVISGPYKSENAIKNAGNDLQKAIKQASKLRRLALALPLGHEVKGIGADPEKSQLVDLQKYCNEEVARVYSLPVVFLQDMSKGTFSNTEQQDLHLVKHTIRRWVEQVEQELNLKLFGRGNRTQYVEFNLDGLLRGDFKTRMEGYAIGVNSGILRPNEGRQKENMENDPAGDKLMIQGATVPIENQINANQNEEGE